jgi:hypothetical protein
MVKFEHLVRSGINTVFIMEKLRQVLIRRTIVSVQFRSVRYSVWRLTESDNTKETKHTISTVTYFHAILKWVTLTMTGFMTLSRYIPFSKSCSCRISACRIQMFLAEAKGRAVTQAVSRWLPTAAARVRVRTAYGGLWWTKRHWGRLSPSTSVFPANHSTTSSIIIITRGWHNRPISGRSAEWTQLIPPLPLYQFNFLIWPKLSQCSLWLHRIISRSPQF